MSLFTELSIVNRLLKDLRLKVFHSHPEIFSFFQEVLPDAKVVIRFNKIVKFDFMVPDAYGMSMVVPWSCKKYSLSKIQVFFINIKSFDSKIKAILNLE